MKTIAVSLSKNGKCKCVSIVKNTTEKELAKLTNEQEIFEQEKAKEIETLKTEILALEEQIKELSVQIKYLLGENEDE